ncbi:MAG: sensor histidine kinase [Spirulina sp.]
MKIYFPFRLFRSPSKIKQFHLVRYFSIASLTAFSVVILILGKFYRWQSIKLLIERGEDNNITLAKSFSNTIWSEFSDFFESSAHWSNEELKAHPETERLRQKILAQMEGLPVVKVKVFSLTGRTIFSTESQQIGEDRSNYPGFIVASSGRVESQLGHRETFSAFTERIHDRQLLSSYIPIQKSQDKTTIEGVLELYSDVTPLYEQIERVQRSVTLVCTLILGILYVTLFIIIKRADRIIKTQHQDLQNSEQRYKEQAEKLQVVRAQLINTEKVSSLKMVAGFAHEINNPINFISGNITYAIQYVENLLHLLHLYQENQSETANLIQEYQEEIDLNFLVEDLPKCLQSMKVGTERIRALILSLQIFSRLDEEGIKKVDLNQGMDSTLLMLNNQITGKISISKQYGSLPEVACYPVQINQVFLNILSNAIDVLLSQPDKHNKHIEIVTQRIEGDRVQILIRDNGFGISSEIQDKIFAPFFTTKPIGKGTGLGLAICYEIVQKHGGELSFRSQNGEGTEFAIVLPIDPTSEISRSPAILMHQEERNAISS